MKLIDAIKIGKDCGLETIEECVYNIELHSTNFFNYSLIQDELSELDTEYKKYLSLKEEISGLSFDIDEEDDYCNYLGQCSFELNCNNCCFNKKIIRDGLIREINLLFETTSEMER